MGERHASATVVALATALTIAALWLGLGEASALSGQTVVYKSPAAANLFLGSPQIVIADRVEGVPPGLGLGAFQLHITYNPLLVALDVNEGPFLASTGRPTMCIKEPSNGDIVFACISTGTAPGPTGDGVLANIAVRPATGLKLRATQYNFADTLVHDIASNTALADTLGIAIAVIAGGDSTVRVRPLEGDVNVDCVVDSVDQTTVLSRLGAHIGSGLYSPYYDLEPASSPDGDIDIQDLQFVTGRNGSTCQSPHPAQPGPPPPCSDNDGDLICDKADVDDDNDGLPDKYEVAHACLNSRLADAAKDPDADGLSSATEATRGTDPCLQDTDADGMSDGYEVARSCLNPLVADASADADADGLSNMTEASLTTNPCVADSDGDGLSDGGEVNAYGTNPLDADSDDDGLSDGAEVDIYGTNPLDADSDDDGLSDGAEVNTYGTYPLDADSDDDGLSDGAEANTYGTNPLDADSDDDGMTDGYEFDNTCLNPLAAEALGDPDGDGLINLQEFVLNTNPCNADTDGDGLWDSGEVGYGSNPLDPDTDRDGCTDGQEVGLDEGLGGRRSPTNPWDFYDTNGDQIVDLMSDIFAVAFAFGDDADSVGPGEPDGYDPALDRSAPGPGAFAWEMGPPDGAMDLFMDTFGVAYQFGHDCS